MTKRLNQETVEATLALCRALVGKQPSADAVNLPVHTWVSIESVQRRLDLAHRRGWQGAVKHLREDLVFAVRDCRQQLDESLRRLETASGAVCRTISAADVYRDLVALKGEFEEVEIDLAEKELAVTTDPIELEGVYLGPFKIKLHWQRIGESSLPYRVIALDPHPAARSDDITHPHVQDECLCEGDGRAAIAAALATGRLFDFFLLVSQILQTYGRGSAYCELDDWNGEPCSDCGSVVVEDERSSCERCGSLVCGECSHSCGGCDDSYCSGCIVSCALCGDGFCSSCLETCDKCGKRVCNECREDGACRRCNPQHEEEKEDVSTEEDLSREPLATTV